MKWKLHRFRWNIDNKIEVYEFCSLEGERITYLRLHRELDLACALEHEKTINLIKHPSEQSGLIVGNWHNTKTS